MAKTWAETLNELRVMGADDALIALTKRATGPARHRARVDATLAALPAGLALAALAWELCADLNGTGGRLGLGGNGRATTRAAWAQGLGKGRWCASDGPAYASASEAAIGECLGQERLELFVVDGALWGRVGPDGVSIALPCDTEHQRTLLKAAWVREFFEPTLVEERPALSRVRLVNEPGAFIPLIRCIACK